MVTTEYPPMQGGVGRYSANLTKSLEKLGLNVYVVCNEKGKGYFHGLSPTNKYNSDVLLNAAAKLQPDIVHIQYEHGLYGLVLDSINPNKISTTIDSFYERCKIPIVTTFHSAYNFRQWMNLAAANPPLPTTVKQCITKNLFHLPMNYWKRLLNYYSFTRLNRQKLAESKAGIAFSQYLSNLIGSNSNNYCDIIYHGAEPAAKIISRPTKSNARARFSLPTGPRIALALGHKTATKGWNIFEKMNIPNGWIVVVNSSENHYNKHNVNLRFSKQGRTLVDLQKDFISEEDLSFLFYAADATILPYTVCSGSGVMFDGLAHGLPFIATDLGFFKEFSSKGLGITVKRDPAALANAFKALDKDYDAYLQRVSRFKEKLKWDIVAEQHVSIYRRKCKNTSTITTVS